MSINFGKKHIFTDRSGSSKISIDAGVGESLESSSQIFMTNTNDVSASNTNGSLASSGGAYFAGSVSATNFYGNLIGTSQATASTLLIDQAISNQNYYPVIVKETKGSTIVYDCTALSFNPINSLLTMTNTNITSETVGSSLISNSIITSGTIASEIVTNSKITSGTIGSELVTNSYITSGTIGSLYASEAKITSGTIGSVKILDGNINITSGTIANALITLGTIGSLYSTTGKINTGTVDTLNSTTITTDTITINSTNATYSLYNKGTSRLDGRTIIGTGVPYTYIPIGGIPSISLYIPSYATEIRGNANPGLVSTVGLYGNEVYGISTAPVTITNASTLYIHGPPTVNSYCTMSSQYSLYVNAGLSYFPNLIVDTLNITTLSPTNCNITSGSIASVCILDGNINMTSGTIASGLISNGKITSGTIASGLITSGKITSGTIGSLKISDTTASTNTATGSLVVAGGMGIAKTIYGNQPYLFLYGKSGGAVTITSGANRNFTNVTNAPIIWSTTVASSGISFIGSNGYFTVPESGNYMILMQVCINLDTVTGGCQLGISDSGGSVVVYSEQTTSSLVHTTMNLTTVATLATSTNYVSYCYWNSGTGVTIETDARMTRLYIYKVI